MKFVLGFILFCNCILLQGQVFTEVDYIGSTYSNNIGIIVGKQYNAQEISFGLRINDPKSSTEPLENINLHPTKFAEYFGLKINYRYYFNTKLKVNPFVMLSSEYSHSPLRSDYLSEIDRDRVIDPDDYFQYYAGFVHLTGLYHIFDQRIGLGFSAEVTDNLLFTIYGGSGVTWMKYDTGSIYIYLPGPAVNNFFGMGLRYRF